MLENLEAQRARGLERWAYALVPGRRLGGKYRVSEAAQEPPAPGGGKRTRDPRGGRGLRFCLWPAGGAGLR